MANYRVVSSDNHVFEPPDLWTSRAKPAFKDRVPQLVREYDGDWWFCNGHRTIGSNQDSSLPRSQRSAALYQGTTLVGP
jgi:hypothetical protein